MHTEVLVTLRTTPYTTIYHYYIPLLYTLLYYFLNLVRPLPRIISIMLL